MARTGNSSPVAETLSSKKLGLLGVLMPGLAQIAPAFNLFFTTGVMASLAGASVPLVFLISMVGMVATGLSLAQFASIYPSAGSFVTYITRSIGPRVATAVGVIALVGYMIAFGGSYVFVGSYIVQNVLNSPDIPGITQIVTVIFGIIVTLPVIVGLQFGIRATVVLYVFEVAVLLVFGVAVLTRGGSQGLSAKPFTWPTGAGASNISSRSAWPSSLSEGSRRPPRSRRKPATHAATCRSRSSDQS